jgi:multidrug transporter EmrE-like cation transporter
MSGMQFGWERTLPYVAICCVVACNVLGNVFVKLGSSSIGDGGVMFGLIKAQTVYGGVFFVISLVCYAFALRTLPLHLAQAIVALQFVGTIIAAAVVFGEVITVVKWTGIALVCVGLTLVLA